MLLLLWYGVQVSLDGFHRITAGLGQLSTRWLKLAIPVSAALMSVVICIALLGDIAARRSGEIDLTFDGRRPALTGR